MDLDRSQCSLDNYDLYLTERNSRIEALQMNYLINVLHRKKYWIRQIIRLAIQNEEEGRGASIKAIRGERQLKALSGRTKSFITRKVLLKLNNLILDNRY